MEEVRKLKEWEAAVVVSLIERRDRLIRDAQKVIDAQNEALTKLAEVWAGENGCRFDGRPDGIWLVRVTEEEENETSSARPEPE